MNLTESFGSDPSLRFMKIKAERDLGFKEISPEGIKQFFEMLKSNPKNYAKWRQVRAGYGFTETKGDTLMKEIGILDPDNKNSKYFCFSSNLQKADYQKCLGK